MTVECTVGPQGGGALVVSVRGDLTLGDVAGLHGSLLKCLAEQPDVLMVEMSALTVAEPLALSVFTSVVRQAARWPGIPVLFYAPRPQTRDLMVSGVYHRLPLFADADAARRHLDREQHTLPMLTEELLPVSGAARQGRNVTTDACLRWGLPHLVAPASLVTSELVSNVVDHAHTMMTLRLSLRRRYLHIAVRDGSPDEPVRPGGLVSPDVKGGRGMFLVAATAVSWGCLPTVDGKVVWASLAR